MDTKQTKTVGERYVAAELAHRDWASTFTQDGFERTGILAVFIEPDSRRMIGVQVETTLCAQPHNTNWSPGIKAQGPNQHEWEYFVVIAVPHNFEIPPRYFIVSRSRVATAAWIEHMNWSTDPEAEPGKRNAPVECARVKLQTFELYENRWDLIFIDGHDTSVSLPPNCRALVQTERAGLPPEYAWHTSLPSWQRETAAVTYSRDSFIRS